MQIAKTRLTRHSYVRIRPEDKFRLPDLRFCSRRNNLLFNSIFNNPSVRYNIITVPLENGDYKFKVQSSDNLRNINDGVEATVNMQNRPYYPRNFVISNVSGNDVTFTWGHPQGGLSVDDYNIYGNGGTGGTIDRTTALATVGGGVTTKTLSGLADGNWLFVIESVSGTKETVNYWAQAVTLPVEDTVPTIPGTYVDKTPPYKQNIPGQMPQNVELSNISVGRCRITFLWVYGNEAKYFRIYHDGGTGTIDWNSYDYQYARQNGVVQSFITPQICTFKEDTTFKIGIRAETEDGVIDDNTDEYEVILDGVASRDIDNFNGEMT